jgi:hypothetical protein
LPRSRPGRLSQPCPAAPPTAPSRGRSRPSSAHVCVAVTRRAPGARRRACGLSITCLGRSIRAVTAGGSRVGPPRLWRSLACRSVESRAFRPRHCQERQKIGLVRRKPMRGEQPSRRYLRISDVLRCWIILEVFAANNANACWFPLGYLARPSTIEARVALLLAAFWESIVRFLRPLCKKQTGRRLSPQPCGDQAAGMDSPSETHNLSLPLSRVRLYTSSTLRQRG